MLIYSVLVDADFNVDIPDAPFESFLMCVEERIDSIAFNCSASVEDLHGLTIAVTVNDHFGTEVVPLVGCYEDIARLDFMTGGRYAVCIFAAALRAGAITGNTHAYHFPVAGLLIGGFRID